MKIVVICPHFEPDVAPTGEVMTRIVHELAARGHELHVFTALPWYLHHRVEPGWTGRLVQTDVVDWGKITRLHPFPAPDKNNLIRRALSFGGFTALATLRSVWGSRADVVLAMSPPLTLGLAGWIASLTRRSPFVFNIQDVYPDVLVETGAVTSPKVIGALSALEKFTYARADAVTVLSEDLRSNLAAKTDPAKLEVIPNFVLTDDIVPADRHNRYREELGVGDATVVMYAGNIGYSQPLELVVAAARAFSQRDDVHFVVNGGGSGRAAVEQAASGLRNITFVDLQPKERLPEVLAAGDIHLVLLKSGLSASSVPSKTYSVFAAGRPLIASVDEGSEVAKMVTEAGAGVAVPPENEQAFIEAVTTLVDDAQQRRAAGRNARSYVEGLYSPAAIAEQYEKLFERLAGGTSGR
ncbi:MAG: glycosyltransferase family 4 protein [Acidimicrobiales bacterium]|nr:glycosyltransferase family 4 protein [Acidimicrobiales bacterium]